MSSAGNYLFAKEIDCDTLRANVTTIQESTSLDVQNPAKTGATSKVINATAGADAASTVLGFYGAAPVDQPATIADATAASTSPGASYDQAEVVAVYTAANDAVAKVNAVIAALKELGLVAAS